MPDIAAQLWTVRDHTKTAEDLAETCRRIAAMGYDGIEPAAIGQDITPDQVKQILDENKLKCACSHEALLDIEDEAGAKAIADKLELWDCSLAAIGGYFARGETFSMENWLKFIEKYNGIAKMFEPYGIRVGYHNHSHEFVHLDGRTVMDLLFEKLDPSIWFEIDTHWVVRGGGDPVVWIERATGRLPVVHFKDYGVNPEREPLFAEVGSGNLNWPAILEACVKQDVQCYIIERDDGELDPFDSLEVSIKNLKKMM